MPSSIPAASTVDVLVPLDDIIGFDTPDTKHDCLSDDFDSEERGKKCDVKVLYCKPSDCDCCPNWSDTLPEDCNPLLDEEVERARASFAILHRKGRHGAREWKTQDIVVNSPLLRNRLEVVFQDYKGGSPSKHNWTVPRPFVPFVHRWEALKKAAEEESHTETKKHLNLLIKTLLPMLSEALETIAAFRQHQVLEFEDLPIILEPGEVVVQDYSQSSATAGVLHYVEICSGFDTPGAYLHVNAGQWDGSRIQMHAEKWKVCPFDGTCSILNLEVMPLNQMLDKDCLREHLVSRGRWLEQLLDEPFQHYRGWICGQV